MSKKLEQQIRNALKGNYFPWLIESAVKDLMSDPSYYKLYIHEYEGQILAVGVENDAGEKKFYHTTAYHTLMHVAYGDDD